MKKECKGNCAPICQECFDLNTNLTTRVSTESPKEYTPIETLNHVLEILKKRRITHTGLGAPILLLEDAIDRLTRKPQEQTAEESVKLNIAISNYVSSSAISSASVDKLKQITQRNAFRAGAKWQFANTTQEQPEAEPVEEKPIDKLKNEFQKWCGFPLNGETVEELQSCVRSRHWDLECELNQQAKYFHKQLEDIENER